ncbi:MBL fold metallo-hydrolase [Paenibacillus oralis]|uniref:MBL fold metallo-hydrolase n=1 Tax=Paenibacillus oralis TaxID=2490856 RepID=A0A3P3UDJ3_9BACL|nr:MBL fold metallo-hydrolase [Paenibacillus oralis]RRJ67539.1 MBL fold metallo-hydrolase [Paenibacillus oralis]
MGLVDDAWFTVEMIDTRTYAISEYGHWEKVHSFLLIGENKAALIDTGLGIDNIKRITDELTRLPIVVITTHVHWDHIGSHGEFDCILVHEAERDWLVHGIPGLPIEVIRKDVRRDISRPAPRSFNPDTYVPFTGIPSGTLRDGDTLDLGNRKLAIFHTPGHSPGHISIRDVFSGYLFTGDLLYKDTPIQKLGYPRKLQQKHKNLKCRYFSDTHPFERNSGILCLYFLPSQGNARVLDRSKENKYIGKIQ